MRENGLEDVMAPAWRVPVSEMPSVIGSRLGGMRRVASSELRVSERMKASCSRVMVWAAPLELINTESVSPGMVWSVQQAWFDHVSDFGESHRFSA